jgi:hypothetical protein
MTDASSGPCIVTTRSSGSSLDPKPFSACIVEFKHTEDDENEDEDDEEDDKEEDEDDEDAVKVTEL